MCSVKPRWVSGRQGEGALEWERRTRVRKRRVVWRMSSIVMNIQNNGYDFVVNPRQ